MNIRKKKKLQKKRKKGGYKYASRYSTGAIVQIVNENAQESPLEEMKNSFDSYLHKELVKYKKLKVVYDD